MDPERTAVSYFNPVHCTVSLKSVGQSGTISVSSMVGGTVGILCFTLCHYASKRDAKLQFCPHQFMFAGDLMCRENITALLC
jgi:hypothetical protein